MAQLIEPIFTFLNAFSVQAAEFAIRLLSAIILLFIGWIVGTIISRVSKEVIVRLKVDNYIGKTKSKIKISDILPMIFQWLVYLVFIQAAVGPTVLGITALADFVGMILEFIPNLIGAVIVIIVGYIIAEYVKNSVEKEKLAYSDMMSKVLFWLIIYVVVAVALDLTQITPLLGQLLLVITAAIGIGVAIAIGLGLKDVVAMEAKKMMSNSKRRR